MHEVEGRGRRAFALFQAAHHAGPLIWILPPRARHLPMLRGLPEGVGQRLHVIRPITEIDLLWTVEEALRSPAVGLVIAEPSSQLSLTAGRRLQLAAETGQTTGVMLIREGQGSNAAETRWHCDPIASTDIASADHDSTLHHWSLNKNKKGTTGSWILHWNGATAAFNLVSEAGQRHHAAEASG
ncbi:MAG: protein ImuA [Rhodobacteraceae bacterium HLUCCO07]|nr:MAG: protein ImuA [Rhodobacteraceae bacterium HLUCCO07]